MSLLGVPSTPFPLMFSSSSTSQTTPATSPPLSTGIRLNPCAGSLGDGLCGRLAGPIPNTVYERKFGIEVDSEHTPINLPSRNMSFPQEYDATAVCSIKQQPSFSSKQCSNFVKTWISRNLLRETSYRLWCYCQVVRASRKLVQTWIVKQLCQRGKSELRETSPRI